MKQYDHFRMTSARAYPRNGAWRYHCAAAALLAAFCGALASAHSTACTPAFVKPAQPILMSGFIRPVDRSAAAQLLPANAKGVVYQSAAALNHSNFRMFKGDRSIPVPVRLVRLFAMDKFDTVTAIDSIARPAMSFYRVEPIEKFEVGQVYQVKSDLAANDLTYVRIGAAVIDASKIALARSGVANKETIFGAVPCIAVPARAAIVQQFAFNVPPAFAPYRDLMFAVAHNTAGVAWHTLPDQAPANPNEWNTGSRALGLQDRIAYFYVDNATGKTVTSVLHGSVAILEIDDAWRDTAPLSFTFVPDKVPAADSLAFLTNALESGDPSEIYRRLDALPLRSTDYPWASRSGSWYDVAGWIEDAVGEWRGKRRRAALAQKLVELSNNEDMTIRSKSKAALQRVKGE